MANGIGAGVVSGGFVGTVVLAMLSLYAPLPQDRIDAAPKLEVETATPDAVSSEDATKADTAAQVKDDTSVAASSSAATAASVEQSETAPTAPTSTAPTSAAAVVQPEAPQGDVASTANTDSPAAEIASTDDRAASLAPQDASVAPAQTTGEIVVASADPSSTAVTQVEAGEQALAADAAPQVETAAVETTSPTVQPDEVASPVVTGTEKTEDDAQTLATAEPATSKPSNLPVITSAPQEIELASADTPITLPQVDSGVITNRLPSVGGAAEVDAEPEAPADVAPSSAEDLGALRAFAAPVEGVEDKALFGVVLIDSGEDGIPRSDLMKLAVPVTIAIDPTAPNAKQIMTDYRAAGIEVVAIANELPTASSPSDVAVAVEAYFAQLPQAVGIMDPLDGRIQSNRSLLQPVLGAIRNSGHGLITYDRGLNTAQQAARREDIPAATVFRVLDADLEESPKIKRYLDRAAFNANRDGAVVVVGRSYPETVKAIVEWVLEKKEAGIAMVPVSAVMLADEAS
ncbi:polysaccharide deacteylase family 2 protein [uncultured Litoreibacter sp.]|uniref:divergent polysaccharide deacetylase family protein n=1 Tax=uncultured Litoreibacter sp. TaxID=1392394 RepID=UPI00261CD31A|nr:polysaccharide deacteylase family 2 protein [uncultured Litoreibacter sp.]